MAESDFVFPEIPDTKISTLVQLHERNEFSKYCFEALRSLGLASLKAISVIEEHPRFKRNTKTNKYAVTLGHVVKCNKLTMSVLSMASKGKYAEATQAISLQISRTAIQCLWLLDKKNRIDQYIQRSLYPLKDATSRIKQSTKPEHYQHTLKIYERMSQRVGTSLKQVTKPKTRWPSSSEMLDQIDADPVLHNILESSLSSHLSDYIDLSMWYLDSAKEDWAPLDAHIAPKNYHLTPIGILLSAVLERYGAEFFGSATTRKGFKDYFNKFGAAFRELHDFAYKRTSSSLLQETKGKIEKEPARTRTNLPEHARVKKELLPPFVKLGNMTLRSWMNDRMPEMLWALILIKALGRDRALATFRKVIQYYLDNNALAGGVTFSELAVLEERHRKEIVRIISDETVARKALSHLRVFSNIPASETWQRHLDIPTSQEESWNFLAECVALGLDHQSQESTDCRWLRLASLTAVRKMHFPSEEHYKEIFEYPNYEDQRKVRPSIRAAEIGLDIKGGEGGVTWPNQFWSQCYQNTGCVPRSVSEIPTEKVSACALTRERLNSLYFEVQSHYLNELPSTKVEAKHDAVCGMICLALSLTKEIIEDAGSKMLGVLGLRTIAEITINARYLFLKNDEALWTAFRDYGIGQAKLSSLKADTMKIDPYYLPVEKLSRVANEDRWEEFVSIDLGDWCGEDLRKRSIVAGLKDFYDSYYVWPSAVSHGQWGAIRSLVFDSCLNPLHRGHRLPVLPAPLKAIRYDLEIVLTKFFEIIRASVPGLDELHLDRKAKSSKTEKSENAQTPQAE